MLESHRCCGCCKVSALLLRLFTVAQQIPRYQDLTQDERIVYSQIESAHTDGTWTKLIRARTNLHDTVTKRCIKSLENKGLIKRFKSSKNSNGICYVLTHLRPSESVTGGAFYQDGEADEDLVHYAMDIAHTYILKMSWEKVKSKDDEKKGKKNISKEDAEAARREGLEGEKRCNKYIPLPPGYQGYPTIPEIAKHLNSRVEFTEKFTEQDIGKVTDLLVWDGRVEKVLGGRAFRAILNASSSESRDEAPCVRCPVFDFCDESGPVNACTCPYFQAWLKF